MDAVLCIAIQYSDEHSACQGYCTPAPQLLHILYKMLYCSHLTKNRDKRKMPFLTTLNTTMYYDIFEPDFTTQPLSSQPYTLLLIHGFGGTPASDFGAQLPVLRSHFCVIAPHLHGYGRSTHRRSYALSFYRDDANDLLTLLDSLHIEKVLVLGFSDGGI